MFDPNQVVKPMIVLPGETKTDPNQVPELVILLNADGTPFSGGGGADLTERVEAIEEYSGSFPNIGPLADQINNLNTQISELEERIVALETPTP